MSEQKTVDINTTISEIGLFIEKLQCDLPEIFEKKTQKTNNLKKILYQGKLYDINLSKALESSISIKDNLIDIKATDLKKSTVKQLVESWLRERAEEIIPQKASYWANIMSVTYNNVSIKDQKSLWGSCSHKGNLNFCWRIIKAPEEVLDYLVIHELAHIKHLNHSGDFWQFVETHCPECKKHRKWLNQYKDRLFVEEKNETATTLP